MALGGLYAGKDLKILEQRHLIPRVLHHQGVGGKGEGGAGILTQVCVGRGKRDGACDAALVGDQGGVELILTLTVPLGHQNGGALDGQLCPGRIDVNDQASGLCHVDTSSKTKKCGATPYNEIDKVVTMI